MARVAAYLRRSSPGEEDKNTSLETQLERIIAWCEKEGHEHVATFSDPGGKSYELDRPEFTKLFAAAKRKEFDVVAVWRFDRFSRDEDQAIIAVNMLKRNGVRVISTTQPLPDGPLGTVMLAMHNFASAQELLGIRERIAVGKLQRIKSNKLPVSSIPKYGYMYDGEKKERYIPNPDTAPIVQRIFQEFASGNTIRGVAALLTAEGVPTPSQYMAKTGKRYRNGMVAQQWRSSSVAQILTSKSYIGQHEGNVTASEKVEVTHPITGEVTTVTRKVSRPWATGERVRYGPDVCPPLVDEEMFQQVQEQLTQNKERSARNLKDPAAVLLRNGLGVCGYCGHQLSVGWNIAGQRYRYFCYESRRAPDRCAGPKFTISAKYLDKEVWEWFMERITSQEKMQEAYERYCAEIDTLYGTTEDTLAATQTALEEAKSQEESAMDAVVNLPVGNALRVEYMRRAEIAHEKVETHTAALADLQTRHSTHERDKRGFKAFVDVAPQARVFLAEAPIEQRRQALYLCRVQVHVWGTEREPRYEITWFGDSVHDPVY